MNKKPGSQFTFFDFIKALKGTGIKFSIDSKGAWHNYVFVERLWRCVKYEEV